MLWNTASVSMLSLEPTESTYMVIWLLHEAWKMIKKIFFFWEKDTVFVVAGYQSNTTFSLRNNEAVHKIPPHSTALHQCSLCLFRPLMTPGCRLNSFIYSEKDTHCRHRRHRCNVPRTTLHVLQLFRGPNPSSWENPTGFLCAACQVSVLTCQQGIEHWAAVHWATPITKVHCHHLGQDTRGLQLKSPCLWLTYKS